MELLSAYRENPCGTLSIPYWKHQHITLPPDIHIVHDRCFDQAAYPGYDDERYFRLYHNLQAIPPAKTGDIRIITADPEHIPQLAAVINQSYSDLSVTCSQLLGYTRTEAYQPSLWVMAVNESDGRLVGCGIADLDRTLREGILEWIQVPPGWRRRGIGQGLVCELLLRMSRLADFATVSGKVNNETSPEKLYRKCGFTGNDIWHILTPERQR